MILPDEVAFKLGEWLWGLVVGFCALMWRIINGKVDRMESSLKVQVDALRTDHRQIISDLDAEVARQRDVSAKIFDKLEAMSKESADRHERLLTALHVGLAGKADK